MVVGKTSTGYIQTGMDEYLKRLKRYIPVRLDIVPETRNRKSLSETQQRDEEGAALLARMQPSDCVVLLDERGRQYTSREFAGLMQRHMASGLRRLVFVIGGPYGFSQEVYGRADSRMSLSRMTFSHEMVRLFFIEQVYRAATILHGTPYHHD